MNEQPRTLFCHQSIVPLDRTVDDVLVDEWCKTAYGDNDYLLQISYDSQSDSWFYVVGLRSEEDLMSFNLAWL